MGLAVRNVAHDNGLRKRDIFVMDQQTNMPLIVHTGVDTGPYPRSKIRGQVTKCDYELFAANGTRVATSGIITVSLDLSLRRVSGGI